MKRIASALALSASVILGATTLTACNEPIGESGKEIIATYAPGGIATNPVTPNPAAPDAVVDDDVTTDTTPNTTTTIDPAAQASTHSTDTVIAPVVRVVDGDTIVVTIDGTNETVRLIGIDTPETKKPGTPVQPFGPEATDNMTALVADAGGTVQLTFDPSQGERDRYQRLLAYVASPDSGIDFGEAQLHAGLAKEYTYRTAYAKQSIYLSLIHI